AGEGVNYWLGGLPIEKREIISVEQKLAINLPSSLKLFSNIHNGFLLDGASAFGVRPLNSLFCLDDYDIFSDLDIDYDPKKCLAFCGDGAGNEQCFSINHPIHENDYMTYDWDHETRELTKPQSFWDFLERFIKNSVW
ncbi:MAG: SMI1/KNR4 family protein, partial [Anaerolineae bacterium]|nr:SMI1/KNR4 family protein [Anaerolineae bacterium]